MNIELMLKQYGIDISINDYILVPCCVLLLICVFKLQSWIINKVKALFNKKINKID